MLLTLIFFVILAPINGRDKTPLDNIAERYVKLALKVGLHNADYIDAYFGPAEWKPAPINDSSKIFPSEGLNREAADLIDEMAKIQETNLSPSQQGHWRFLDGQIKSLAGMIDIINGKKMTFNEESLALYGIVAPSYDSLHYDSVLQRLNKLLPGEGSISERMTEFRNQFLVPRCKIDTLIKIAIADCRALTGKHIKLPDGENFTVELVANQPWGAYNWYKGDYASLIQIDTSDEIRIPDIIGYAAHEGYPGHHVQNILQESAFYRDSGWAEFCVQPLFSPTNLIMEGAANFGIELLFPKKEWAAYMKKTICPLAGIDTSEIDRYYDINKERNNLSFAGVDGARRYIDGEWSKEKTIRWLMHYRLMTRKEAEDDFSFYEKYRAYIITYSVGESLIRNYIETHGGTGDNPERGWELFTKLLATHVTVSDLIDSTSPK